MHFDIFKTFWFWRLRQDKIKLPSLILENYRAIYNRGYFLDRSQIFDFVMDLSLKASDFTLYSSFSIDALNKTNNTHFWQVGSPALVSSIFKKIFETYEELSQCIYRVGSGLAFLSSAFPKIRFSFPTFFSSTTRQYV